MGALRQMMWNGSGQLKPGVLHMAHIDAGNPGRLLVPYTTYGHESRQPVGKGTVALVLGNDDVLRASIVDIVLADRPDEPRLGPEELSMLPRLGTPHVQSPRRTKVAAVMQSLVQTMPTTRPIDW